MLSRVTAQILPRPMYPHNEGYYHVAYILATTIYAGYVVSLYVRWKRARTALKLEDK